MTKTNKNISGKKYKKRKGEHVSASRTENTKIVLKKNIIIQRQKIKICCVYTVDLFFSSYAFVNRSSFGMINDDFEYGSVHKFYASSQ